MERRGSVSDPVVVGRSKIRLMTLFVGSSGGIASFSPCRCWPPTATHNVFLLMVLVVWLLSHMLLAELGLVSAGADMQPTATHYAFLLMVLVIWMIDC
ncbi:hypothetical protein Nepgr_021044 [Nepenthes gracilis]|uniref:Uncharacterized protein n=1 Tax=Nepenthes gracilis TaxID=150966 RepID=A0AAD3SW70_NEPGR|nr:hypothetical protein Nepgr_021044 [Nepenthes gracilis]